MGTKILSSVIYSSVSLLLGVEDSGKPRKAVSRQIDVFCSITNYISASFNFSIFVGFGIPDSGYKNLLIMIVIKRNIKNGGLVVFIYALIIHSSLFAQSSHFQKKNWTVAQIKEWALNNQNQRWHGWLLYQGTDSSTHHFISRIFDEWVWFSINRREIVIEDERVYKLRSKTLGYYYVDAINGFIKTKEY